MFLFNVKYLETQPGINGAGDLSFLYSTCSDELMIREFAMDLKQTTNS